MLKGIPITDSHFWQDEEECSLDVLKQVFRSCTNEEMPLLAERLACLREAGKVLYQVCFQPWGRSPAFSGLLCPFTTYKPHPDPDVAPRGTNATLLT